MAETPQQSRVDLAQRLSLWAATDLAYLVARETELRLDLRAAASALRASTEQGARVNPRLKLDVRGFPWCVDCGERTVLEPRCPDCSTPRRPESAPPEDKRASSTSAELRGPGSQSSGGADQPSTEGAGVDPADFDALDVYFYGEGEEARAARAWERISQAIDPALPDSPTEQGGVQQIIQQLRADAEQARNGARSKPPKLDHSAGDALRERAMAYDDAADKLAALTRAEVNEGRVREAEVVYRYRAAAGESVGPLRETEAIEDGKYAVRGRYEVEAVAVLPAQPDQGSEQGPRVFGCPKCGRSATTAALLSMQRSEPPYFCNGGTGGRHHTATKMLRLPDGWPAPHPSTEPEPGIEHPSKEADRG